MFHNLQNYDSHLIFQKIEKYDFKLNAIPKMKEKYTSFTIKQPIKKGIRKNVFACLFSIHNTISLSRMKQVCLIREDVLDVQPYCIKTHYCFLFLRDQIKVKDNSISSVTTVLNRFLSLSSWIVSAFSSVIRSAFVFKPLASQYLPAQS